MTETMLDIALTGTDALSVTLHVTMYEPDDLLKEYVFESVPTGEAFRYH